MLGIYFLYFNNMKSNFCFYAEEGKNIRHAHACYESIDVKENLMKSKSILIWTVFAILIASIFLVVAAVAGDKTCMLKAVADKVHVTVWDEDSEEDRQGKIFTGWLKSGQRQKIQSNTGFIVYSYKLAVDDRSYGDNHKTCKGGNTIRVP